MPPLSQGLALNSQTLSALSLILAVPKVIASAGSEMYQDRMLSASLLQPGAVNVKSRRGFLKFCGTCTTCRRNVRRMVCKCIGEDPKCSRSNASEPLEMRNRDEIVGGGRMRRRTFGTSIVGGAITLPFLQELQARALGDPTVTIDEVTPTIAPAGSLPPAEERTVELFERNTYSVVNIFDVSLRPQVNMTGSVEVPEGNGSGFIWDEQGHIVTNYHVIGSSLARNPPLGQVVARVTLLGADGYQKNFEAKLVGADKTKDLAVLDVDAPVELLRPVNLGQSSKLRVGQRCLAIGNPFGFDHTLTVGVVSGLNRDIYSQTGVVIGGGIQTDAAINPGNSGGVLLDSNGNLIGINTAIFTRTGTSAGVGFAIPVDTVAKLVPQLIAYGKVMRPGLNVQFAPEAVAKQLNVRSGALVLTVPDKSAAAKAGIIATRRGLTGNILLGDIIVGVGETTVKNPQELTKALDSYQVGDQILLKVQRNDQIQELPLTLEESMR